VLFLQSAPPLTPIIIRVMEQPTKEISVADILMGSVGITFLFLLTAALLGFVLGSTFIMYRRWRDARDAAGADETFHLTQPPRAGA
jgi:hypothetical protein